MVLILRHRHRHRRRCRCRRGMEALTKAQLLKDIDELHEVTEESETEYIGYEFGKRSGSEENPDKQKWLRREIMPEDKMSQLVAKYAGTFTKEEIADHWTTWVLQGKSWKNMEGPVRPPAHRPSPVGARQPAATPPANPLASVACWLCCITSQRSALHPRSLVCCRLLLTGGAALRQAEVMRSQKNRDGQWKYTEGCIDPDLICE